MKDKWLFLFLYPVMALSVVHIGNDNTFLDLIRLPSYYTDIIVSVIITYAVGWYIRTMFFYLEKNFPKGQRTTVHWTYHFVITIIIPALIVTGVELLYLNSIGIDWRESSIFYLELPLVLLFLVVVNLIYYVLFNTKRAKALERTIRVQEEAIKKKEQHFYVVRMGHSQYHVPKTETAYFYTEDKVCFLVKKDGKKFLCDRNIREWESFLPHFDFFQLNRQVIAKRSSIVKFNRTATRRMKIELSPAFPKDIYISKTKAPAFLDWVEQ